MLDAFWSGVGEELARTWVARVLTPAFVFWVGGLALVWWQLNAAAVAGTGWFATVTGTAERLGQWPVVAQVVAVVGGLLVVAASAVVAERMTLPVLRLLEGYWPGWLAAPSSAWRRSRAARTRAAHDALVGIRTRGELDRGEYAELLRLRRAPAADPARRAALEARAIRPLSTAQAARLTRLAARLASTPVAAEDVMPTRLGDVLRAAERRPLHAYGIDAPTCWPALWLTLPAETRTELTHARSALDAAARSWLWGALFLVWGWVNPWAWAVGFAVMVLAYRFGVLPRALAFGSVLVTAFDLHRMPMYAAMHLPRPAGRADEVDVCGPRLTRALAGHLAEDVRYEFDQPLDSTPPGSTPLRAGAPPRRHGPLGRRRRRASPRSGA